MTPQPRWRLRQLTRAELDLLYTQRIEKDFPSAERPSLPALRNHMEKDLQTTWIMTDGQEDVAYAVCAQANGIVLVSLLAVYSDKRGGGKGTALLSLLRDEYADERAIVLEVEDPADATDEKDLQTREKRIAFYVRSGYRFYDGIEHTSFGVRLMLMAHPLADDFEHLHATAIADVTEIYHKILPQAKWGFVTTAERP